MSIFALGLSLNLEVEGKDGDAVGTGCKNPRCEAAWPCGAPDRILFLAKGRATREATARNCSAVPSDSTQLGGSNEFAGANSPCQARLCNSQGVAPASRAVTILSGSTWTPSGGG